MISGKLDENCAVIVDSCRRFETTYWSHLTDPEVLGQTIGSIFQTSVRIYHYYLRNNPEEGSSKSDF